MEMTDEITKELKGIREAVGAEFDDKIKALDAKAKERWDELKATPDAVIGESLKTILDDKTKAIEAKQTAVEAAMTERMDAIETSAKARVGGESEYSKALKTLEEFKVNPDTGRGRFELPTKVVQIISRESDYDADDGGVLDTPRPGVYAYPQAPLSLSSVVMPGTISGMYFPYERELAGSLEGDADYHTEAADKATMDIYTEAVVGQVATIAVTTRVATQVMDDRAAFFSFLRARLAYRVQRLLNSEMVSGAGTADIEGINTIATAYDDSHVGLATAVQKLDVLLYALNQVGLANYSPNYVLLHPTDWASILSQKDEDDNYMIGTPASGASVGQGRVGTIWGVPVVTDVAQTLDDFTVGDGMSSQLLMRKNLEVLVSTEDQDNFTKNLVTIRAELRALLVNYSALGHVTGDFSDSIAAT